MEGQTVIVRLLDRWRRRYWRPQPGHDAFDALRPMAVVTGGATGLGLELSRLFAKAGHNILLVARGDEALSDACRQLSNEFDVHIDSLAIDLTSSNAADEISNALTAQNAYADILINNAGIGLSGDFLRQSADEVGQLTDLNMRAATLLMHRFLPDMIKRGRGGVLNIASLGGYAPGPNQAAYYASKAYLISLSEAVAAEVAGKGVRISVAAPGPINTDFHSKMAADKSYYLRLMPVLKPHRVAKSAWFGYMWGQRVIIPGVLTRILSLAMRITPHPILVPIVGWLLKRRG
jgi:short-subunit dehydrogenase